MYCLPSASQKYGPCARSMNRGVPPTERNARTGEFTPPGMVFWARSKRASFLDMTGPALNDGFGWRGLRPLAMFQAWIDAGIGSDGIRRGPARCSRLQEIKMKLYRSRLASARDAPSSCRIQKDGGEACESRARTMLTLLRRCLSGSLEIGRASCRE